MSPYHSALDPQVIASPLDRFHRPNGVAFVHDIMTADRLPEEYDECDVLYADPPWYTGYKVFTERWANAPVPSYDTFMTRVVELIDRSDLPAVIVIGKQATKYLDGWKPVPVRLQRFEAIAYYKRMEPVEASTAAGVLEKLAQRYRVVGDFFAGYGSAARAFTLAGKRFVVSDCNPRCISVMRRTLPFSPAPLE